MSEHVIQMSKFYFEEQFAEPSSNLHKFVNDK